MLAINVHEGKCAIPRQIRATDVSVLTKLIVDDTNIAVCRSHEVALAIRFSQIVYCVLHDIVGRRVYLDPFVLRRKRDCYIRAGMHTLPSFLSLS